MVAGLIIRDTATYTCGAGFELVGSANRTCIQLDADNNDWSPPEPMCVGELIYMQLLILIIPSLSTTVFLEIFVLQ